MVTRVVRHSPPTHNMQYSLRDRFVRWFKLFILLHGWEIAHV